MFYGIALILASGIACATAEIKFGFTNCATYWAVGGLTGMGFAALTAALK